MCLATPGKITKIEGQKATVDYGSEKRQVLTGGEKIKVGDYVMVQMGIIIRILTLEEVKAFSHP